MQESGRVPGESLSGRFERLVRDRPDEVSVRDASGAALTRRQLWESAQALGTVLRGRGVAERDVVLILLPNRVEWQVALLACLQMEAVPATIPMTTDTRQLSYVLNLIGAKAILTQDSYCGAPTQQKALDAAIQAGHACQLLALQEDDSYVATAIEGETPAAVPEHLEHLMFTSSTTGYPKAVMHTRDTLAAVNRGFVERFGIGETTPLFMPSPVGHSVGAWHGGRLSLFTGAPLVLQDRWDPLRALQLVEEHECYFTAAATPFLKDLVEAPWEAGKPKLASLRIFLCGGAPVPPHLMAQAATEMPSTFVSVLWGMTEGGVTTSIPGDDPERTCRVAGAPLPGLELCILPTSQGGAGGEGELGMRGAGVFVGYLGQDDLYSESITPDGFFRTGDLARFEPDGYLVLTGRLKDLIVRGGVNISPLPTEDALQRHPRILQAAVIGWPDDRIGERLCAVVVLTDGAELSLAELNHWLTDEGLTRRWLPEHLIAVRSMPLTAAGKIRKVDLRAQLLQS